MLHQKHKKEGVAFLFLFLLVILMTKKCVTV